MKPSGLHCWSVACLALGLFAVCLGSGVAEAADGARRIGIVNISRVFNGYTKVSEVQKSLEARFKPQQLMLDKDRERLELEMRDFQGKVGQREMSRDEFKKLQDLQGREYDLKERFRGLAEDVEKERLDQMKQILKEIKAAITFVGKQQQFDLVLRAPEYGEEGEAEVPADASQQDKEAQKPKTAAELVRRFRENPVLFHASGVDVTQDVMAKLNADHGKEKPAAAPK